MIKPFHNFPKAIYAIRFFYLSRDILFIYKQVSLCFVQIKVTYFYLEQILTKVAILVDCVKVPGYKIRK